MRFFRFSTIVCRIRTRVCQHAAVIDLWEDGLSYHIEHLVSIDEISLTVLTAELVSDGTVKYTSTAYKGLFRLNKCIATQIIHKTRGNHLFSSPVTGHELLVFTTQLAIRRVLAGWRTGLPGSLHLRSGSHYSRIAELERLHSRRLAEEWVVGVCCACARVYGDGFSPTLSMSRHFRFRGTPLQRRYCAWWLSCAVIDETSAAI